MEEYTSGRKASWSFSGFYHKTIIHSVRTYMTAVWGGCSFSNFSR